ncbi:putative sulfur transporter [Aliarcobacter cibarius]|uniref:YeeE/YedE family protein n=1 Tax=Aliarcobacter cibarius TaxID=255507 RepID=UPI001246C831|nr:YeeE/YedE family protein [Aliarcobacter cibarius]QEZ89276.1 putative sulfur transporter [Aliarcobacter cibarius]
MFELETYSLVNILGLALGIIFGFIAQKNQFCFSGSIKDFLQIKSTKRAASVIMAMIVAVISTQIISNYFEIDLTQSAYFKKDINYFAIIVGGALFGAGMMIADGCSSRSIVKFAQGDSNALITLIFIAIFAYTTTKGVLFEIINPFINNPTLIEISKTIDNFQLNIYVVLAVLFVLLYTFTKKVKRVFSLYDGVIVGLLIGAAWFVTGYIGSESMEKEIQVQAISFVYPSAKTLELFTYYQVNEFSFGVCLVIGALVGTFVSTLFNKKYSFGCTANKTINKVKYNMIGGAMMGVGGIMAIGCTVGQGLSGLSTLVFSSFLAIISIFVSGYFTGKYLLKKDKLAMCFIFEWEDENKKKSKQIDFQI